MKIATSAAIRNVGDWWRQREPRERAMLAIMVAALAAFGWWYGAYVPLRHVRDDARSSHAKALGEMQRMKAELVHLAELQSRLPPRPTDAVALKKAVAASAAVAGLAIARQRDLDAGQLQIECDAATPKALFEWLDTLRLRHGLAPSTLSVAENDGRLRIQAVFSVDLRSGNQEA